MLISDFIRRYQSLNLNHVREHSMPIYEFRWQMQTHVFSQGGDSPYCPVVKWDGNDRESFGAKTGADLFSLLWGNNHVLRHFWLDWKKPRRERRVERQKISDRWILLKFTAKLMLLRINFLKFFLLLLFFFFPLWPVFISVLCYLISFALSRDRLPGFVVQNRFCPSVKTLNSHLIKSEKV